MLRRSYPRLTGPPANLETAEMLGGVVEGFLKAMRSVPSPDRAAVFALADRHIGAGSSITWPARDERPVAVELRESLVSAPASSESGITPDGHRMLEAIDNLPEDEREVFGLTRIHDLHMLMSTMCWRSRSRPCSGV